MAYLICILLIIVLGIFAFFSFREVIETKKEVKELEKKVKSDAEEKTEIIKTAETLITGNDTDSFNASIDLMHQYANRKAGKN